MKRILFWSFTALLSCYTITASAQQQIAEFLKGNVDDAKLLSHAYLQPMGKMFGTSLNGGWYQSAGPHKLFGFDITFSTAVVTVPNEDKFFDINELGLNQYVVVTNSSTQAPSIAASHTAGRPTLAHKDFPNDPLFTLPKGAGISLTPMMLIQGSLGLPLHSELTFRFFPTVNIPKVGRISLWGIGVKNEFKEFIPGLKLIPIDLSVMLGYTNFTSEFNVNYKPNPANMPDGYTSSDFNDQKLILDASGFTARLLIGKTLPFISFYAGLGYGHASTDFGLKGLYPLGVEPTYLGVVKDPFVLAFTHSNFNGNIGFRLRFGVLSVNCDYTLGDYPLYSLGLGISFR